MTDDSRPETGHGAGGPERPLRPEHGPEPEGAPGVRRRAEPMSARADASGWPDRSGGLTPERAACIRQRIVEGTYDSSAVLRVVARRILGSGDLSR